MGMFSNEIAGEKDTIEKQYNTENQPKQYFKLTDNLDLYSYRKEGTHYFDIIPWKNTSGKWCHNLATFVYMGFGQNKDNLLCLAEYGKPDPIRKEKLAIEEQYGDFKEANEHGAKAFLHKKRCMYLVRPLDDEGNVIPDKKLAILEVSVGGGQMPGFPMKLTAKANACIKGAPVVDYADPEEGKTIVINVAKSKYNGRDAYNITSVDFCERSTPVGDLYKTHGINLEELLVWPTYAELEQALYGMSVGGSEKQTQSESAPREEEETDAEANAPAPSRTLKDSEGKTYEDPFPDAPTEQEEPYESDREEERDERDEREEEPNLCSQGFPYGECMLKAHANKCKLCPMAEYRKCKAIRDGK